MTKHKNCMSTTERREHINGHYMRWLHMINEHLRMEDRYPRHMHEAQTKGWKTELQAVAAYDKGTSSDDRAILNNMK